MTSHRFYEGVEERDVRCSRCGCLFRVRDPDCGDEDWMQDMGDFGVDQDCDVQLVKETLSS